MREYVNENARRDKNTWNSFALTLKSEDPSW